MSARASLLSALCSLCLCGSLFADDAKEPYQFRVVVHAEKSRLLTDVFRDQVKRELHDGLQAGLGALARVEVSDTHPLLPTIRGQGLKALDNVRERLPERVCFVLIDFTGTQYQVQTRQFYGPLGLPSPVVRKGSTRDRAYVARVAAFLLERDIGLVGTIATEPDASQQVRLELKGGGLGVDLARWVKKGEVFQVLRGDSGGPAQPVEGAFLQVVEPAHDGSCTCRLFTRYRQPQVAGLRAVLLGTRSGPLRLRVRQEKPGGAVGPLTTTVMLQMRKSGFEGEDKLQQAPRRGEIDTSRDGDKGVFDHLAFVSVLSGETLRARVPVPILDDEFVVLVVPATSEEGNLILESYRAFRRGVLDALRVQDEQFRRISELSKDPEKRAEAMKQVTKTLDRLHKDHAKLMDERQKVMEKLNTLDAKDRPRQEELQQLDKRLADLKSGEADLKKHIALLEEIEKKYNDPQTRDWKVKIETAALLEGEAEVGKALEVYEKAPPELLSDQLKKHIEELKKQWKPKDEKHEAARRFIYEVWPGLDTGGLKDKMKEAQEALAECKKAGEPFGPRKMRNALKQHLDRIRKELDDLKPGVNIEDDKKARIINEVVPALEKLDKEIDKALGKDKGGS